MKITFVMGSGFTCSGGDRVIATYAEYLYHQGHDVFVISRGRKTLNVCQKIKHWLKGKGWPTNGPFPSHFDYLEVPHLATRHRPIVDSDLPDADIVIATWWETVEWVMDLANVKGVKAHFIQHHEVFDYDPNREKARASYRLPLQKITISNWLVDLLREQYGYLDVALVPNGVDLAQFDVPERLKQPVPTVGMLYHSASWKGCDICLKAVAIARKIIPQLRLVAFGHQPPAENLPLPSNTEFTCLPPQTLLKTIYAQCDAWLFGSRVEGFGLPILEAMACRTPVIATPAGAAPELIAQGGGILVPPESPQAMADAIITICQMAQRDWLNLSAQAYACALNYDVNQACRQFESVLKQIYAQTRQPARATP